MYYGYNDKKELILADRKKIAFTVLLGKILSAFNVDIEEITEDNAKNKLVDLVERYRLQFLPNLITQSEKDTLVAWLEENLTDFDAYIILKNIPSVLNVFRRGINRLNKKAFKITPIGVNDEKEYWLSKSHNERLKQLN